MKEKEAIWNKSLPGVQKDGLLISSNFNARKALESLKKQWKEIPKEDETLPLNSEWRWLDFNNGSKLVIKGVP